MWSIANMASYNRVERRFSVTESNKLVWKIDRSRLLFDFWIEG